MKKNDKKKTVNSLHKSYKKLSLLQKFMLMIVLLFVIFNIFPVIMILLIGLLPTLTVLLTDPKNSDKLVIVGSFNLAGVFIYLLNVINSFTIYNAFYIVGDIFNLIIMLGSAALGLICYYEIPNSFIILSKMSAQKKLTKIDAKLSKLADDWGTELIDRQKE